MDHEIRVYERALLRSGQDPRTVAAALLGVKDVARFFLLVESVGDEPPHRHSDSVRMELTDLACASFRKVTGVFDREGIEQWRAAWALPVVTVEEQWAASDAFRATGARVAVWDSARQRSLGLRESAAGWNFDRIEEGWREPSRDSEIGFYTSEQGRPRFGISGGNMISYADRIAEDRERVMRDSYVRLRFDPLSPPTPPGISVVFGPNGT